MIQANELRLGNWIRYTQHIVSVRSIRHDSYVSTTQAVDGYLEEYDGIALTPEILEKAGFKEKSYGENKGNRWHKAGEQWHRRYINNGFWLDENYKKPNEYFVNVMNEYSRDHDNQPYFKYLHQLQNLYFAFTGKELKISL